MELLERLEHDGYALVPGVLDPDTTARLRGTLERLPDKAAVRRRGGATYAVRNLLTLVPEVAELAGSAPVRALVEPVLGPDAFPVQGLLFNKAADANWKVPWHQDITIAVRERAEAEGYYGWAVRAGVPHVHPPLEVLEGMLTVRLHLDPCDEESGALRVLPGSHRGGRLSFAAMREWRERGAPVVCALPAGGALLMRPLLLHASSESRAERQRRVVHLDFAAAPLPGGVEWYAQVDVERAECEA